MYRTLALVAVAALLLALLPLPYGYYRLLRFGVCAVAAYGAVQAHRGGLRGWTWALGAVAVLFNPLVPAFFERAIWAALDVATAAVLAASIRPVVRAEADAA